MILTCDNCQTRYLVPSHAVGPDGRTVRCSHCSHEWYQDVEDDAAFAEEPEDLEPIPESVKPVPEGSSVPVIPGDIQNEGIKLNPDVMGYAAAACVFFLVLGALFAFRVSVVHIWPASAALYQIAGLDPGLPGEGLLFEEVRAVAGVNEHGANILNVDGQIVNLADKAIALPPIQASLRLPGGDIFDSWLVHPAADHMEPHAELSFRTSYPEVPGDVKEINLRFVPER